MDDFREFYGELPLQEVLGEMLLLSMKTYMLSLLNSEGKSNHIGTTCCMVKGIELLKVWCRSTNTKLKPVHLFSDESL